MILKSINRKRIRNLSLYDVIKMGIIVMVAFYLVANFKPFFDGADAFLYGVTTIDLFNGSYGFTNNFLQETGSWDFVPYMWDKTIHNTAIPIGDVGIYGFTSIFYFLGGLAGLFYLGPILTVLFLIISERVATKLFGKFVGLLTLVFLASDFIILWIGAQLRNDNIYAIFFVLGCFYLIKFFHDKKNSSILFCSTFFVIGTFIRLNGIITLPLEILLILGYFGIQIFNQCKNESNIPIIFLKKIFSKIRKKDFIKKTLLLFIPWIIFFGFFISFNQYYYGDPFTDYFDERPRTLDYETDSKMSIFKIDSWRFTWINFYSVGLLPDILNDFIFNSFSNIRDNLGGNPIGIISLLILLFTLVISLYYKEKRTEIIVLTTFILGIVFFFSAGFLHNTNLNAENYQPTLFSRDRYMIPALPLYLMIFSFSIFLIWKLFFKRIIENRKKIRYRNYKKWFLLIAAFSLTMSLFSSTPAQAAWKNGIEVNNLDYFFRIFPFDSEGLSEENSIILEGRRYSVVYDAIPFFPYWGYWDKLRYEFDWNSLPEEPIERLKQLMDEGYNVYAFKDKYRWGIDSKYFRYLENQQGLILTDFSNTFCKLERINDVNLTSDINSESFKSCRALGSMDEADDLDNIVFVTRIKIFYDEETQEFIKQKIRLAPSIRSLVR